MPEHHIIHTSALFNINLFNVLPELAAIRTRYYPQRKRCCSTVFLNHYLCASTYSAADSSYVKAYFGYEQLTHGPLTEKLEQFRLGLTSLSSVSESILTALDLTLADFPDQAISGSEFPNYLVTRTLPHLSVDQIRAFGQIECALNAQITISPAAIQAFKQFIQEHPDDTFSLVNTSIFPHVAHICSLLQAQGLQVTPAATELLATGSQSRAATMRASDRIFLHSSCMYGAHPIDFLDQLISANPTELTHYYSESKALFGKIARRYSSRLTSHLIDNSFQEVDPHTMLQCSY